MDKGLNLNKGKTLINKTVYSLAVAVLSFCLLYGCTTNQELKTEQTLSAGKVTRPEYGCNLNNQAAKSTTSNSNPQANPAKNPIPSDGPLAPPTICFPKERHDFGKVMAGTKVSHKFEFANMGDEPLKIIHIQTSCGCATSKLPKKTLQSGQSTELEITYHIGPNLGKKTGSRACVW